MPRNKAEAWLVPRDNFEQPKPRVSPGHRRGAAEVLAARPNSQNAPAQVLWEVGLTLAVWLLAAVIVGLLLAAAR